MRIIKTVYARTGPPLQSMTADWYGIKTEAAGIANATQGLQGLPLGKC
jgi:hypothetical protein